MALDRELSNEVQFVTFIIIEFAKTYKMGVRDAYIYLKKYGGLDFIWEHWWGLHTENPYYAVHYIFKVCKNNGGYS